MNLFILIPIIGLFGNYPTSPREMTPGSVCTKPIAYRYKEQIPYCGRDVSSKTKADIIKIYDVKYDYQVGSMDRHDFTIDHYISLCMGGSNEIDNLWPQHKSTKAITDPLEPLLCIKMSEGRIGQAESIRIIREAKMNLDKAEELLEYVKGL